MKAPIRSFLLLSCLLPAVILQASELIIEGDLSVEGDATVDKSLHVHGDGGVVFKGTGPSGTTPGPGIITEESHDVRFWWYPARGAMRWGDPVTRNHPDPVLTPAWTDGHVGLLSTAWGQMSEAKGYGSTAWGEQADASGRGSTAWGQYTSAMAGQSTAWGNATQASGSGSTAWGAYTSATGDESTVWGDGSLASGNYATAMGSATHASGQYATTMGIGTLASSAGSLAIGDFSVASGYTSVATGVSTEASGASSATFGWFTHARSRAAFAVGQNNIGLGGGSTWDWHLGDSVFEIGIGDSGAPFNAMTVLKNGQTTLANLFWDGQNPTAVPTAPEASGGEALVVEGHSRIEGNLEVAGVLRTSGAQGDLSMGDFTAAPQ